MFINRNKSESTLKMSRVTTVKTNKNYRFPTVFLNSIITLVTIFCITKIAVMSFGLFGTAPAGLYSIYLTGYEQKRFFILTLSGCGAICFVNGLKKHSVKATVGLLLAYAVYFLYNYKLVANGFVHALNKTVYTIETNKGLSSDIYYLTYFDSIYHEKELKYFCWAVIFGTCFLLAFAVVKHCNPIIFTVCVALYAAVPLAFNIFVGEMYFVVAASCCIVVFVMRIQGYSNSAPNELFFGLRKRMKVKGRHVSLAAFQQSVAFLLCITLTLAVASEAYDYSLYQKRESVEEFGKDLLDTVQSIGTGNFSVSFGNTGSGLNNGDLSRTGDLKYTGETMFRVKTDNDRLNDTLYLRAFTAANYNGKRWTQLTNKTYNNYTDMWKLFKADTFYPQFMDGMFRDTFTSDTQENNLTIVNEGINSKIFLTESKLIPSSTGALSFASADYDNAFTANAMLGMDSYEQTVLSSNESFDSVYLSDGGSYESITELLKNGDFSYMYYLSSYYPDYSEEGQEDIDDFYEKEKLYRSFVTENYLSYPETTDNYIPDGFDVAVREYYENSKDAVSLYSYVFTEENEYGEPAVSAANDNELYTDPYIAEKYYNEVISLIKNYLHENAEYTLTPGTTPYGEDFVEYFIKENHQGYCVHFATAATLLLRRAGIPARYVEGYFVSENDLLNTDSEGFTDVPDSRAHAWTEVYYPLIGWQVVDFTPSYGDEGEVPKENDSWKNNVDTETDTDSATDSDTEESDTDSVESSDSESDTQLAEDSSDDNSSSVSNSVTNNSEQSGFVKDLLNVLKNIFIVILIIAAIALLWLAVRLTVTQIRRKRFCSKDRRKAAKALYIHSLLLLSIVGISLNENEGEEQFAKRVCKEYSETVPKEFESFTKTALTARFGRSRPNKDEIAGMQDFADKLFGIVYESSGKCKKLIIKYILFLH